MALSDNLVAYWSLEEASGTRVDATGRSNDLTPNNTPGNTTGKVGNAVQLTIASSQWLSRASTSDLAMGNIDFTIAAWVYADSLGIDSYIVSKWSTGSEEYSLGYSNGSGFIFIINNFAKFVIETVVGVPSTATWYFVVAQHDSVSDLVKISVNAGTFRTAATAGQFPAAGSEGFAVGDSKQAGTASKWNGRIDEVGIWKRALSSAEITELYNSGSGRDYAYITAVAGQPTMRRLGLTDYMAHPIEVGRKGVKVF